MKRSGREEIAAVKKAKHVYQVICALVLLFPLGASLLSGNFPTSTRVPETPLNDVKFGTSSAIDEQYREQLLLLCCVCSYLVPRLLRQMRGESGGTHSMEEPHFRQCFLTNFYSGKYFVFVACDGSFSLLFLNAHLIVVHSLRSQYPKFLRYIAASGSSLV
ncbi:hypothetical protein ACFX19_039466 [Malus domestica]